MDNLSRYAWKMLIDGYMIRVDLSEFQTLSNELNKIGVNINQIAWTVNATGTIFGDDTQQLKEMMDEIWRLLKSSLSGLLSKSRQTTFAIPPRRTAACNIYSEHCVPQTAALTFQHHLSQTRAGGNTIDRHLIQSFAPGETTPEQAREIGRRLATEILVGQYAYVSIPSTRLCDMISRK